MREREKDRDKVSQKETLLCDKNIITELVLAKIMVKRNS